MGRIVPSTIAHRLPKPFHCVSAPRTLLVFALLATIARLGFVWLTEPSPADAYYYLCSRRLAPAYFDGPAGTALLTELASVYGKSDVIWRMTAPSGALSPRVLASVSFDNFLTHAEGRMWLSS